MTLVLPIWFIQIFARPEKNARAKDRVYWQSQMKRKHILFMTSYYQMADSWIKICMKLYLKFIKPSYFE